MYLIGYSREILTFFSGPPCVNLHYKVFFMHIISGIYCSYFATDCRLDADHIFNSLRIDSYQKVICMSSFVHVIQFLNSFLYMLSCTFLLLWAKSNQYWIPRRSKRYARSLGFSLLCIISKKLCLRSATL